MIPAILLQLFYGLGTVPPVQSAQDVSTSFPFNNPPGVDIWCGKAYRETNSSFDPGGWLFPPNASEPGILKLDLKIYPRYNLYLASERKASFIIDTPVQYVRGQRYQNWTFEVDAPGKNVSFTELLLQIKNVQTNNVLVNWTRVPVNATGYEIEFDLNSMPANLDHPWTVNAIGNSPDAVQSYHAGTTVTVLPVRNDTGSVARIDYLHGGVFVLSSLTNNDWKSIYPYSFYTSWDWISSTITNTSSPKTLVGFRNQGYNLIHPVPPGGDDPFDHDIFEQFLKLCDTLELYVMYDMRHTYQNNTSIDLQLSRLIHHPSLLLYYTADEPDGQGDPLNATSIAYKHIKKVDPYHPVSLVLNCANFYFREYTSGADIILEDIYPVAVNTSFSTVYNTPCNTTYGDCGCDNCHANSPSYPAYVTNPFLDITDRVDSVYKMQEWAGKTNYKKPVWGVPQAFYDKGSFWQRFPTPQEEIVMGLLRLNHGAKGVVAWIYPTSVEIEEATSSLAKVITGEGITKYTLGATRVSNLEMTGLGKELVDATAWVHDETILVSYVYVGYDVFTGQVEIVLPETIAGVIVDHWGPGDWSVQPSGKAVVKEGLVSLESGIMEFKRSV